MPARPLRRRPKPPRARRKGDQMIFFFFSDVSAGNNRAMFCRDLLTALYCLTTYL